MKNTKKKTGKDSTSKIDLLTLSFIDEYLTESFGFKITFNKIKEYTFEFGYMGRHFGASFTEEEKERIWQVFSAIEGIFSLCDAVKGKKVFGLKEMSFITEILNKVSTKKADDERFSNYDLIEECLSITTFWKYFRN